jgi:hypothetical protein
VLDESENIAFNYITINSVMVFLIAALCALYNNVYLKLYALQISDQGARAWCRGWFIDDVCRTTQKVIEDECKYFIISCL